MPKNTTERCCEKCKCNHADLPNWRDHFDECKAAQYCHEHNCKCHTTTENGWEEEFYLRWGNFDESPAMVSFIQHIAKEQYERGRKDIAGFLKEKAEFVKITDAKLNDLPIVEMINERYLVSGKLLEAALETPNDQSHD